MFIYSLTQFAKVALVWFSHMALRLLL